MFNTSQSLGTLLMLASLAAPATGAEPVPVIEAGAAITSQSMTQRADGRTDLVLALEGAGKLVTGGATIRFHIACTITDLLSGQRVLEGAGQCVLNATDGGQATVQFQTIPGAGDIGHLQFNGGTKRFAGLVARIPIAVSVNPFKVAGKKVFFIETSADGAQPAAF